MVTVNIEKIGCFEFALTSKRVVVVWCGSQNELNKQKIEEVAPSLGGFFYVLNSRKVHIIASVLK